jgi:large subunit ribosomal protein L31
MLGFPKGTVARAGVAAPAGNCRRATPGGAAHSEAHQETVMKPGIHPEYREVVFQDMQNDFKFITRSTLQTRETIEFQGKTYPLFKLDTSSESHPFYTGAQTRIVETGRVEKFRQKFAAKSEAVNAAAAQASAAKAKRK